MAGKVNKKFLIIFSSIIVGLAAVVGGVGIYVWMGRADRLMSMGEESRAQAVALIERVEQQRDELEKARASGDAQRIESLTRSLSDLSKEADEAVRIGENRVGRIVSRDPGNTEARDLWLWFMNRLKPEDDQIYEKKFSELVEGLRQNAEQRMTNLDAQHRYLSFVLRATRAGTIPPGAGRRLNPFELSQHVDRFDSQTQNMRVEGWESLRGYRAIGRLAEARQEYARSRDATEKLIALVNGARDDIDAVIEASGDKPVRSEVIQAIAEHFTLRNEIYRITGANDASAAFVRAEIDRLNTLAERGDGDPVAKLLLHIMYYSNAIRQTIGEPPLVADGRGTEALANQRARFPEILASIEDMPDDRALASWFELSQYLQEAEPLATNSFGYEQTRRFLRRIWEAQPEAVVIPMRLASMSQVAGRVGDGVDDYAEALDVLDRVEKLPRLPIGIDGIRQLTLRTELLAMRSSITLDRWRVAALLADGDATVKHAATLGELTKALAARVSEENRYLLLCQAREAFVSGNFTRASTLIDSALSRGAQPSAQINWMRGRMALARGNTTIAVRYLEPLVEIQSTARRSYRLDLAQAYESDGRIREAMLQYEAVQREIGEGASAGIDAKVASMRASLGEGQVDDPIRQALIEASLALQGAGINPGDPALAMGILEEAIEAHGHSAQLYERIAEIRLETGDTQGAIETLERLIASGVGEPRHDEFLQKIRVGDVNQIALSRIDELDIPLNQKRLRRATLYRSLRQIDRAKAELQAILTDEPGNTLAIEQMFQIAVAGADIASAERFAQRARELNIDNVDGAYFRGIVASMRNDRATALGLLQRAVDRQPDNIPFLQALASEQTLADRTSEAVATYERSIELRANDEGVLYDYVTLLQRLGREPRALQVLRAAEVSVSRSNRLRSLRLDLEARIGDRAAALAAREAILAQNPRDAQNAAALIGMYNEFGQWSSARRLLDRLRAEDDRLVFVILDAEWHALQSDEQRGQQVINEYLQKAYAEGRESEAPQIFMSLGEYFSRRGQFQRAESEFERAASMSPDDDTRALRMLADTRRRLGQHARAAEAFEQIIAKQGANPDPSMQMELTQSLLRAGQIDEAERVIVSLRQREEYDYKVTILRARIAEAREDLPAARAAFDEALKTFPDASDLWASRAELSYRQGLRRGSQQLIRDAIRDIDEGIRRDPSRVELHRFKALASLELGLNAEAATAFREAVRVSRGARTVTLEAVARMLRVERFGDAAEFAEAAVTQNPTDGDLAYDIGQTFASAGRHEQATRYFRFAWERSPDQRTGLAYAEALMSQTPPRTPAAQSVFSDLGSSVVESDWQLLLVRAVMFRAQGRQDPSAQDALRSFELASALRQGPQRWLSYLERRAPLEADRMALLQILARRAAWKPWSDLFRARIIGADKAREGEAMSILRTLVGSENADVQRLASLQLADLLVRASNFAEAEGVLRQARSRSPQDAGYLSGLAYVLARGDGDADEAMTLARSATQIAPDSPEPYNALGWAHWRKGNLNEAQTHLTRAHEMVRQVPRSGRIGIAFALASVHAENGDGANARGYLRLMDAYINEGDELSPPDKALEDALRAKIDSLG